MKPRHLPLIGREIRILSRKLIELERGLRRLAPMLSSTVSTNGARKDNRHSRRLSAKARASMVLQGRYMGYMRQLKPRQKAQVRKVREATGVRSAISTARQMTLCLR